MRSDRLPPILGPDLWVCHLGLVGYRRALAMQEQLRARRQAGELPDTLLLLEHPPVYTRGRRASPEELPLPEDFYRRRGIELIDTDRGGRVTHHAPGQLVGYPIMAVQDVRRHVRTIEATIIAALAEVGISARSRHEDGPDYIGVWVADRKIASIGVHVQRGVATHGFAVNVANDLEPFSWVVACGLPGVAMTSLARELGERGSGSTTAAGLECMRRRVAFQLCQAHGRRQRLVSAAALGLDEVAAGVHTTERQRVGIREPVPV